MAAVVGSLSNNQVGNLHRTQEREPSPWDYSTPVNHETGPSTSMSYAPNNQTPPQKLNFNPPSPPKFNGIPPARNQPSTPERHGQAHLSGRQSRPRSGAGMDPSYLSPPPKIGSRPELNASRSGSEADSLLDLYSKPRSLGESSLRGSMDRTDRVLAQEEPFLEDEDPERSRWIHRDKLAMIESHEMQEAGIKLPPQRQKSAASRSRSRREKNRSQDQTTMVTDQDDEIPSLKDRKKRRMESPTRQDDGGDHTLANDFDIRTPEEIAADNYADTNTSNEYRQAQPDQRKSSRIPLPRSSPMPIPQDHIERDTPLPRKRGISGNFSNGDENGLSYTRVRSRNNSVGSAILLDDMETIPNPTSTPASKLTPLSQSALSKTQRTPSSAQRPKSRSGLETTPLSQKPRNVSTTASPRTPSSTRPKSRSGLEPRPATAVNRPEGEAPWLATMYKPDPRLPPEEQLLPTHAKRLQQEQWERAQKESQQRMRETEAQQRKHNHQKPPAQLPREFSPLAEHTINGLQPSSRDADEQTLQERSASEWPLTQTTPRKPPPAASGGLNANPALGGDDGGQHAGYSPIPRVKQGASLTLGNITDIRPGQRTLDPFERERMARRDEEKGGRDERKKEKACGCCVVM